MIYKPSRVYKSITKDLKRYNMLRGGTRSTKSFSLTQMVVRWLMYGKIGKYTIPRGDFFILRESFPALRRTVYKDFKTILSHEGFMNHIDYRKSTHEFERHGRVVSFFSADDDSKIHGPQSTFFWMNETPSMPLDIFQQLDFRCSHFAFMDYNPMDPESWVRQLESGDLLGSEEINLDVSTVHDNEHLSDMQMKAILSIKDDELRNVYLKGQWTKLHGLVFPNFEVCKTMPEVYDKRYFAIDFGWTHPFTLLEFRQVDNNIYIYQHVYESEYDYENLRSLKPLFEGVRGCADSQDPRAIKTLRELGFKVRAVKKPKIVESIRKVRSFNLFVHQDGIETLKEIRTYKRQKKTVNGEDIYIEDPVQINDHSMDALRYGITTFAKGAMVEFL